MRYDTHTCERQKRRVVASVLRGAVASVLRGAVASVRCDAVASVLRGVMRHGIVTTS